MRNTCKRIVSNLVQIGLFLAASRLNKVSGGGIYTAQGLRRKSPSEGREREREERVPSTPVRGQKLGASGAGFGGIFHLPGVSLYHIRANFPPRNVVETNARNLLHRGMMDMFRFSLRGLTADVNQARTKVGGDYSEGERAVRWPMREIAEMCIFLIEGFGRKMLLKSILKTVGGSVSCILYF